MITYIYDLPLLGIYTNLTEGLDEGDEVVFAGAIDIGSKVKKTNKYASIGVKYCPLSSTSLVTRFLLF